MSRFWHQFVSNGQGEEACAELGIHGHGGPVFPSLARNLDLNQRDGVEVWRLDARGPAENGGLLEDAIILAVEHHPISTMDKLCALAKQLRVGVPVEVTILRGECRLTRWLMPAAPKRSYANN